jgi:hypothetical protein
MLRPTCNPNVFRKILQHFSSISDHFTSKYSQYMIRRYCCVWQRPNGLSTLVNIYWLLREGILLRIRNVARGVPVLYLPAPWSKSFVTCRVFRIDTYHHNYHPRTSSQRALKKMFVIWSAKCDDVLLIQYNPLWLNALVYIHCTQCIP